MCLLVPDSFTGGLLSVIVVFTAATGRVVFTI